MPFIKCSKQNKNYCKKYRFLYDFRFSIEYKTMNNTQKLIKKLQNRNFVLPNILFTEIICLAEYTIYLRWFTT